MQVISIIIIHTKLLYFHKRSKLIIKVTIGFESVQTDSHQSSFKNNNFPYRWKKYTAHYIARTQNQFTSEISPQ